MVSVSTTVHIGSAESVPPKAAHVYEVDWVGDGTTISALFQDTVYGNNNGSLTLEILALQ